jgi:hypothetical protein
MKQLTQSLVSSYTGSSFFLFAAEWQYQPSCSTARLLRFQCIECVWLLTNWLQDRMRDSQELHHSFGYQIPNGRKIIRDTYV